MKSEKKLQERFLGRNLLADFFVMPFTNENREGAGAGAGAVVAETAEREMICLDAEESSETMTRLDFRHASSHLSQKRPGFYLILLRNELRHRSLKDKPSLF